MDTQDVHIQVAFPVATVGAVWAREGFHARVDHQVLLQVLPTVASREHFAAQVTDDRGGSAPLLQHNNMHRSTMDHLHA